MSDNALRRTLHALDGQLIDEILDVCRTVEVEAGLEVIREGSYIKELPLLLKGLVRVYVGHEDKEFLLYYIQPAESCVMSLSALLEHAPSRIHAVTEQPSTLLLLPEKELRQWIRTYPTLNNVLYHQFHTRYADLIQTILQVTFGDLSQRLEEHLRKLCEVTGSDLLDVRHARLATELGTAREVVTRTVRKLERDGVVRQEAEGLRLLRR